MVAWLAWPMIAAAEDGAATDGESAFHFQERSTVSTIGLTSMEEESLSNTVIEGGLASPAAGVPVAGSDEDFYLDPLSLQPSDGRTDLGRSEIPAEINFTNPKNVPGQIHGNNYSIQLPANRSYGAYGTNISER